MGKEEAVYWDWDQEAQVQKIVNNFKQGIQEGELAAKLARYREIQTEIESLEAIKESLRQEFIQLGRGEESISAGGFACFFKKVAGRVSTDWKQAYRDAVGEMSEADVSKYVKKGEESIRVEVRKL